MAEEQLRLAMQCICNAYAMHHDGDASQFVDMILLELFDDFLISLLGTVVRLCGRHESVQVFCNDLLKLEEPQERELSAAFLSRSSSLCLFFLPGCRPFSSRMWHVCRRVRQTKPVETTPHFRNFGSHVPHETPSLPDLPRGEDRSSEIGR